ncbi:Tetraacyldisaccharide 4'-kinase [Rubrivivax sp. A210]|uniref:tetraacyldisaccharide 4'-kinase n=1 Tax=Rubrivivax sp. A210 TaxID=2772301 RepID=UPI00191884B3|nr:tetraacyldisaccharide 4'-kinase [Rubrivivax sp. A210]CAD5365872.1 Tetraacyldisaccharide 4'-kinase [Rubrivivax sp. A210]
MSLAGHFERHLTRHWWQSQSQPTAMRLLLGPLARLYGVLAASRRRHTVAQRAPVPLLVVGNVVAGGAGKTPAVIALVKAFQDAGRRPGVISRGFGRKSRAVTVVSGESSPSEVGDEPLLIHRRTGVPVCVGRARHLAALVLCTRHPEIDVLIADDGLQHHALARDAELLVFDQRGIGNGQLLPAGPLREPMPTALGPRMRVLYTGGWPSTTLPGALATRQIAAAWPLDAWRAGDISQAQPLAALRGRRLLAAAGLAAPEKFFAMLEDVGLLIRRLPLPDHYDFATLPWRTDTPEVVVTEKDAVKINPELLGTTRLWVLPLDLRLPDSLVAELLTLLKRRPS